MDTTDNVPTQYELPQRLSGKDVLAMILFLVFLLVPMFLAIYVATTPVFHLAPDTPLRAQLHGRRELLYLAASVASATLAALAGKYLWLCAMCRVLSSEHRNGATLQQNALSCVSQGKE